MRILREYPRDAARAPVDGRRALQDAGPGIKSSSLYREWWRVHAAGPSLPSLASRPHQLVFGPGATAAAVDERHGSHRRSMAVPKGKTYSDLILRSDVPYLYFEVK
jgi:hypothetical protein